jgi:hypothetical protein
MQFRLTSSDNQFSFLGGGGVKGGAGLIYAGGGGFALSPIKVGLTFGCIGGNGLDCFAIFVLPCLF